MEVDHFRVIPFPKITASNCDVIAGRGEAALVKLRSWSLDRAIAGSLSDAIRWLKRVASSGNFGRDAQERRVTLDAIHLCSDFYQVAASLGESPIKSAVPELAIALQGGLTGTGSARKAREYLSQYWVGTVLTLANVEPRIIGVQENRTMPDFVIDLGGLDCAIEVKRPASFRSSRDALDRAAGQLRSFGRPGVICLDLTDCLPQEELDRGAERIDQTVWPLFQMETELLSVRPEKYNQSDKYKRVIALVMFARATSWRGTTDPEPAAKYLVQLPLYENACGGLVTDYSQRLKRLFLTAFERISGSPPDPQVRRTVLSNTR